MPIKSISVSCALVLVAGLRALPSQAPGEVQSKLAETVTAYSVDEWGLAPALMSASSTFQIPMGIEWIEPTDPKRVTVSVRGATVGQILESIVTSQPGYHLELERDMVRVFYEGALEDKTNFLNIRLTDFPVRDEYVAVALVSLQRVVKQRALLSPPETQWFGHVMLDPHDRRMKADFNDATVREILNNLTLQGGRKVWVVTFRKGAGLTPGGFRRTSTIWNNSPISDEYQPVWDRYEWGVPLPPIPTR